MPVFPHENVGPTHDPPLQKSWKSLFPGLLPLMVLHNVPGSLCAQVPLLSHARRESHGPLQALWQQVPPTQNLDAHESSVPQVCPGLRRHTGAAGVHEPVVPNCVHVRVTLPTTCMFEPDSCRSRRRRRWSSCR